MHQGKLARADRDSRASVRRAAFARPDHGDDKRVEPDRGQVLPGGRHGPAREGISPTLIGSLIRLE